ncbi:AI-2E family transporter [Psittacicella hinzii]|uniref:AI-2E family transporter n=1 Tax=Psittacicella hinzii TaxID=2028575 RepID=A0A3A1YRM1_9GAMM|nr:AI-2E family transporter [Psittacicella hinzii]RIY40161.1 hypothetical protein CKF58_01100 [Psittacicella hinzii]
MSSWKDLITRNFNNPQIVALILILAVCGLVLYFFGGILAPVFLALGLAYILNFPIRWLMRKGFKRLYALILVFGGLICVLGWLIIGVAPILIKQLNTLIVEAPSIINLLKTKLLSLEQYHLPYLDKATLYSVYENLNQYIQSNMDIRIDNILAVLQNVMYVGVNIFLVPFMAFLMLVDYGPLKESVKRFLPQSSELANGVFKEFMSQLDNYVRGKVIETIIMTALSFIGFMFFGLKYNLILSALIGISVIIPYLGVVIATIPFVLVCFFQFQFSSTFWTLMVIHGVLQIFNGNILVPYLYSKTNNIRPITVIVAVIFFGQIWGIVGVFLAIPLCTLIKAVANAWYLNSQLYFELQQREETQALNHKTIREELEKRKPKRRRNNREYKNAKTNNEANNSANSSTDPASTSEVTTSNNAQAQNNQQTLAANSATQDKTKDEENNSSSPSNS